MRRSSVLCAGPGSAHVREARCCASHTRRSLSHVDAILALAPSLVLLGSGQRHQFPSAEVMAACLTRGIGIEVMDNAAAARTFNVLATEGRKVVAAFLLG